MTGPFPAPNLYSSSATRLVDRLDVTVGPATGIRVNFFGISFLVIALVAQFALPRRFAMLPLILSFAWMTRGQLVDVGFVNISVTRIIIVSALFRGWLRGEHLFNGSSRVDKWIYIWALLLLATTPLHLPDTNVYRLGLVWDYVGVYFVFRIFITKFEDIELVFKQFFVAFLPVAISMMYEQHTNNNIFRALGGVPLVSPHRTNGIRACGPFPHPILAGTAGAILVPMAAYFWKTQRRWALFGGSVGLAVVYASGSSGPMLMALIGLACMAIWPMRRQVRFIQWMGILAVFLLSLVMNDPVYFLLAKVDIAGGSMGWHRAQLIQSTLGAFSEWWLYGTDYTRHWMPTGIPASDRHTDITNHYIAMAVYGGLSLLIAFIGLLASIFRVLGTAIRDETLDVRQKFLAWTLGSILVAHSFNFLSIVLFDQSIISFLAVAGMAAGFRLNTLPATEDELELQASAGRVGLQ